MRILGFVPARGGSKGVPGKNIKLLHGKPLIAFTTEVALQSKLLTTVIVSSDDDRVIEVAKSLGVMVPFVRPAEISQDDSPTIDGVIHALKWFEANDIFFDAVCILQPTSPFRTVTFLDQAIDKFCSTDCDSLVSVLKVPHGYNPHWTFEVNQNGTLKIATGEAEIIGRRQDLPQAFHRDGSIYIVKSEIILEKNSLYGEKMAFIESLAERYVNIDTAADWEKAERLYKDL